MGGDSHVEIRMLRKARAAGDAHERDGRVNTSCLILLFMWVLDLGSAAHAPLVTLSGSRWALPEVGYPCTLPRGKTMAAGADPKAKAQPGLRRHAAAPRSQNNQVEAVQL